MAVRQLFIDLKKAHDSGTRKVLYNILMKFGMPLNLLILIKMHLNKSVCKVPIGKHFSGEFLGALAW